MIKGIIFDLDGTLADTIKDLRTAVNAMLTKLGYPNRSLSDVTKFINNGAKELIRRSLPRDVQNVEFILESAIRIYEEEYAKCYCEKTQAFGGVDSMLMDLKGMGYKIGVLSNKQDNFVKDIIYKLFDRKIFSVVMGQSSLPPKPNPASALLVAKTMGVKSQKCIYIGDSDVDIKTAFNAGMKQISVSWGYRDEEFLKKSGASHIAKTPDEVVEMVKRIAEDEEQKSKK